LLEVPGLGEATFTQAAGFLKITGGDEPLDETWIHPESYDAANKLLERLGLEARRLLESEQARDDLRQRMEHLPPETLAEELSVGLPTLKDILEALARPGRDPRTDLPGPVFKKGILNLDDLQEGMELTGTVGNVVDFGAFVDVGLKDSGLVHISQMSVNYVPSPHSLVSVGDVLTVWVLAVDKERKRVSLTMVKPGTPRQVRGPQPPRREPPQDDRGPASNERRERRRFRPPQPQVVAATLAPHDTQSANSVNAPPRRKKGNAPPVKLTDDMVEGKQPLQGFDQLAALWKQSHPK
jgi:uncharacterized protein